MYLFNHVKSLELRSSIKSLIRKKMGDFNANIDITVTLLLFCHIIARDNKESLKFENIIKKYSTLQKHRNVIDEYLKPYFDLLLDMQKFSFTIDEARNAILEPINQKFDGTYTTPEIIVKVAEKLLDIKSEEIVYDLCSGQGTFLSNLKNNKSKIMSYEISEINILIQKIKSIVLDVNWNICQENIFEIDNELKADKIFIDYPVNQTVNIEKEKYIDNYLMQIVDSFNTDKLNTNWKYILKVISLLKENGKAVVVIPTGNLNNIQDKYIRSILINSGIIKTVINLPGKLFHSTNIEFSIILLQKNNQKMNGITIIDLSKEDIALKYTIGKNEHENDKKLLHDIFSNTKNFKYVTNLKYIDEIAMNNYSLVYKTYKDKVIIKNGRSLKDICYSIRRNVSLRNAQVSKTSVKKDYICVELSNIDNGLIYHENNDKYLDGPSYLLADCKMNKESIIISALGTDEFKVAIVEDTNLIPTGNLIIIDVNKELINPYYLLSYLMSSNGQKSIMNVSTQGHTNILNSKTLLELQIPYIDIADQNLLGKKCKEYLIKYRNAKDSIKSISNDIKKLTEVNK